MPPQAAPSSPTDAPPASAALSCGNCGGAMRSLRLSGHYAQPLDLDLCEPCHLVWFDRIESARLGGPAILALVGHMAEAQSLAHMTLKPQPACPRCRGALKAVHNRSRWGRSMQLECLLQHGAYQSFAQFLSEKGLVRPMSSADRAALLARDGRIDCVNCGAAIAQHETACSHCLSVPSLFDVARLARALDPEGAIDAQAVHATAADRAALQCMACGAAVGDAHAMQCAQCNATLAVSRLADAHRQVSALGPALHAHARQPAAKVVKRRMEALASDMPRQREWLDRMRADNAKQHEEPDEGDGWLAVRTSPLRAVFIALAVWFTWWFWG